MKILLIEDNSGEARLIRQTLKEANGDFTLDIREKLGAGLRFYPLKRLTPYWRTWVR